MRLFYGLSVEKINQTQVNDGIMKAAAFLIGKTQLFALIF